MNNHQMVMVAALPKVRLEKWNRPSLWTFQALPCLSQLLQGLSQPKVTLEAAAVGFGQVHTPPLAWHHLTTAFWQPTVIHPAATMAASQLGMTA